MRPARRLLLVVVTVGRLASSGRFPNKDINNAEVQVMANLSRSGDAQLLVRAPWTWRLFLFGIVVVAILSVEQLLQSWWLPGAAAELAVGQLQPSHEAAESLRVFEWARHAALLVVWGLIVVGGLALFVPLPQGFRRWLRRVAE